MTRSILIAGRDPVWLGPVQEAAAQAGLAVHCCDRADDLVARAAVEDATLVLLDAGWEQWAAAIAVLKSSPASRRIPIVMIATDAGIIEAEAGGYAGLDAIVAADDLAGSLPALLMREADPALADALACQCAGPLPALAVEGLREFNAGNYYRQHDLLEALWRAEAGPVRNLYRAILQIGIAYYQIERGNMRGALKILLRCRQWLVPLPDVCQGVDVAHLRVCSDRVRAALEKRDPSDSTPFDRSLLQPVRLIQKSD